LKLINTDMSNDLISASLNRRFNNDNSMSIQKEKIVDFGQDFNHLYIRESMKVNPFHSIMCKDI